MRFSSALLLFAVACAPDANPGEQCPDIFEPVCDVDGQTHSSACVAQKAGVTVAHPGACEGVDAGGPDDDAGQTRRDSGRPAEDAGQTDDDAGQSADDAGVDAGLVQDSGPADTGLPADAGLPQGACGTRGGVECPEGAYCRFSEQCGANDSGGVCVWIGTERCPPSVEPVCGCDGQNYGSACMANRAGVSVAYEGRCLGCGVEGGVQCNRSQHCDFGVGNCEAPQEGGTCVPVVLACPEIFDPVCGCDGQTYGNTCEARVARVQVASNGACREPRGGDCGPVRMPVTCNADQYCDREVGQCPPDDRTSVGGICVSRPGACSRIFQPVCGCDNQNYSNPCHANRAGTSVRSRGACP